MGGELVDKPGIPNPENHIEKEPAAIEDSDKIHRLSFTIIAWIPSSVIYKTCWIAKSISGKLQRT